MISPSTKFTTANSLTRGIPATNGDYPNSDKDIFIRETSIKPLKRLKTLRTDSFNKVMTTPNIDKDIYMSQQHNNKYLAEQFFFQSHSFSDLTLNVQGTLKNLILKFFLENKFRLDRELYVDKSVLSTVSKVFQSYFHDENINSIDIVDISSNEMMELLQFLYPQFQCTINYQNVTVLLMLGRSSIG